MWFAGSVFNYTQLIWLCLSMLYNLTVGLQQCAVCWAATEDNLETAARSESGSLIFVKGLAIGSILGADRYAYAGSCSSLAVGSALAAYRVPDPVQGSGDDL